MACDVGWCVPPQLKMECPTVKLDTTEGTREKGTRALRSRREGLYPAPASDRQGPGFHIFRTVTTSAFSQPEPSGCLENGPRAKDQLTNTYNILEHLEAVSISL